MLDIIKFLTVLALVVLSACQPRGDATPPTTNSHIINLQGQNVEEFKLTDGTPCVKSIGVEGGITCDWGYNRGLHIGER